MIERLEPQLKFIPAIAAEKQMPVVCVEAGHIYTDEVPSLTHEVGAMVGANVSHLLERMGIPVQKMLFIDDYNATSQDLDVDEYQALLAKHGFVADNLVMESSLTDDAEEIITTLQHKSMTEQNKHGATILKKQQKKERDVVLRKSHTMGATPACAALDAALYIKKNEDAGICVTVLHTEWKGQQNAVKKVLSALGKDIPILEVYYTDEGEIEIEFDY